MKDRTRARKPRAAFKFDRQAANDFCEFIEQLPHVEGTWDSPTITLEPAQIWFIVQLFGFRRPDGTRRFTNALYSVARKNAKSTLAAAILIAVYCLEDENGAQIITAAMTGDQARIVWNIAKRMIQREHDLAECFSLESFANAIARYDVGGTFKPINAKASTQDGLNPSALCFDEIHAHKDHDLYTVLRSAVGSRKNPLYLYTTTEGYENPGPWREIRQFAQNILKGAVKADHFLALYYAVDDKDDDFDEATWIKANPLLGVAVSMDTLREFATEAKQQPGMLGEFRIKRLNRAASAANSWIDIRKWQRCGNAVDLDELAGYPCCAAFDLASTRDMTACWYVWKVDGDYYTWGRYWVPEEAVKMRTERGTAEYESWIEQGLIEVTPGDVADYDVIEAGIREDFERFEPAEIAYDPWNAQDLVNRLTEDEFPLVLFVQGPRSYHPAMQELERAYVAGRLHHGGNPVLQWNAANLVDRRDVNMNMAPDKKRSADKIDGIVSVIMALGRVLAQDDEDLDDFLSDPIKSAAA